MLDRSEDPAKMIRMVILEMEETLVDVRASAARCIADGKEIASFKGHKNEVFAAVYSCDGRHLASGSGDRTVHIEELAATLVEQAQR